jgi:hypothetical protein
MAPGVPALTRLPCGFPGCGLNHRRRLAGRGHCSRTATFDQRSAHRTAHWRLLPPSLTDVTAVKNELGITVNDVVVGLCAPALREWLAARDELPDSPLVALVPTIGAH